MDGGGDGRQLRFVGQFQVMRADRADRAGIDQMPEHLDHRDLSFAAVGPLQDFIQQEQTDAVVQASAISRAWSTTLLSRFSSAM